MLLLLLFVCRASATALGLALAGIFFGCKKLLFWLNFKILAGGKGKPFFSSLLSTSIWERISCKKKIIMPAETLGHGFPQKKIFHGV